MAHAARIIEVFSSLQGEGPYTGEPTTFVRFALCRMGCSWCDTAYAMCDHSYCRVVLPDGLQVKEVSNPITVTKLNELLEPFSEGMLSVTGGEPLEQVSFLLEWRFRACGEHGFQASLVCRMSAAVEGA
jgi:organic radical activating enzyme